MADYRYELSWTAAFRNYTLCQLVKDSLVPIGLTVVFVVLAYIQDKWTVEDFIEELSKIVIGMIPDLISILIATFAIWISFFLSNTIDFIKESETGEALLHALNASFLIEIGFAVIGAIYTLCVLQCCWLRLEAPELIAGVVNFLTLFVLLFMSFALLWWLIYIAKNLHNIAKFTILYKKINAPSSKIEDTK